VAVGRKLRLSKIVSGGFVELVTGTANLTVYAF
jgi:hypothetical protein